MATGRNIEIRIATTGAEKAAADIGRVDSAIDEASRTIGGTGGFAGASQKGAAGMRGLAKEGNKVTASSFNMRAGLQNAGYQVQDFAVQVGGGTSATRAFAQQGPQLLSVLGPWGVALGTIVAVGAPLAGQLLAQAEAIELVDDAYTKAGKSIAESARAELEAADARAQSEQRAAALTETMRRLTEVGYEYNDVQREEIRLLKEKQDAENAVADATGQRLIEEAAGDPVRQEQIRNQVRKDAQQRELRQIEEQQAAKQDLLQRLIAKEEDARTRGVNEAGSLNAAADAAAQEALGAEKRQALRKAEAKDFTEKAENARGPRRGRFREKAQVAADEAADEAAAARAARAAESDFRSQAKQVRDEAAKEAKAAYDEANKLFKEINRLAREAETKRSVFAERDAAGDTRETRARSEAQQRAADESRRAEADRLGTRIDSAEEARDATARDRGLSIRNAGLRTGNKTLQGIGKRLADGTNEAEIQSIGDQVREQQATLGRATVEALTKVLQELQNQQEQIDTLKARQKSARSTRD